MSNLITTGTDPRTNATYLVDSSGKAVYFFLPTGVRDVPKLSEWRGASRDWAGLWKPVLVPEDMLEPHRDGMGARYVKPDAIDVGKDPRVKTEHFGGVKRSDLGGQYQLYWGGDEAFASNAHVFWGLYTYSFDGPMSSYVMRGDARPPGWVNAVWAPAEVNSAKGAPEPADPNRRGGPVGQTTSGGP